jgi:hypothetical protein
MSRLREQIVEKAKKSGLIRNENDFTPEDRAKLLEIDRIQNKQLTVDDILNYCDSRRERAIKELTTNYTTNTEEQRIWYSCFATILGEIASNIRAVKENKRKQEEQLKKLYNLDND